MLTTAPTSEKIIAPIVLLLLVITFTAGMVDAISVLGLGGVFTSLMTGNVVQCGIGLAGVGEATPTHSILAIVSFLIGAGIAGRIANKFASGTVGRWLLVVAWIEFVLLLFSAGLAWSVGETGERIIGETTRVAMIAIVAIAMGIRNATIIKLSVADMKTTVLTLTLTDLGSDAANGNYQPQKYFRRIGSIVTLVLGAFFGAFLIQQLGVAATLGVMAIVVLFSTILFSRTSHAKLTAANVNKS